MTLGTNNTYVEPTSGAAINSGRESHNFSLRALLSSFYSVSTPTSINIVMEGAPVAPPNGMLFRSANTNALYISDSVHKKGSPVGGNFTRVGIGNRVENGIVALGANAHTYEIGELVATVSANGGLAANSRLYLCVANGGISGSTSTFLDVGAPAGIAAGLNGNVSFTGQSATGIRLLATSNIAVGTVSPSRGLHVNSDSIFSGPIFLDSNIVHNGDVTTLITFPSNGNVAVNILGSEKVRVNSTGVGINTSTPVSALQVNGTVTSVDYNSTSDVRLKEDIITITNGLDVINKLNPVKFVWKHNKTISHGLIAQEVEEVIKELVTTDNNDTKYVAYLQLIPYLIAAIQELETKLKNR